MNFEDEKDYIMRIIKEMVRVLFSLMLGKKYVSVEQEVKNGYEVSGKKLDELLTMIDNSEKNEDFLQKNNYSKEEVLDGINQIMQKAGYSDLVGRVPDTVILAMESDPVKEEKVMRQQ